MLDYEGGGERRADEGIPSGTICAILAGRRGVSRGGLATMPKGEAVASSQGNWN
jgi:hypothetical protein